MKIELLEFKQLKIGFFNKKKKKGYLGIAFFCGKKSGFLDSRLVVYLMNQLNTTKQKSDKKTVLWGPTIYIFSPNVFKVVESIVYQKKN